MLANYHFSLGSDYSSLGKIPIITLSNWYLAWSWRGGRINSRWDNGSFRPMMSDRWKSEFFT